MTTSSQPMQIVAFLSAGVYHYAEHTPGTFFPAEEFNPYATTYTPTPPRGDWMNYIRNWHLEIFTGVEWVPIQIETVFETLVGQDGSVIPVLKLAHGSLPDIYHRSVIPHAQIFRVSKTDMMIQSLMKTIHHVTMLKN
jgi:hypothetical protein